MQLCPSSYVVLEKGSIAASVMTISFIAVTLNRPTVFLTSTTAYLLTQEMQQSLPLPVRWTRQPFKFLARSDHASLFSVRLVHNDVIRIIFRPLIQLCRRRASALYGLVLSRAYESPQVSFALRPHPDPPFPAQRRNPPIILLLSRLGDVQTPRQPAPRRLAGEAGNGVHGCRAVHTFHVLKLCRRQLPCLPLLGHL